MCVFFEVLRKLPVELIMNCVGSFPLCRASSLGAPRARSLVVYSTILTNEVAEIVPLMSMP